MSVGSNYALERILAAQVAAKQTAKAFGTGLKNQGVALAQMLGNPLDSLSGALSGAHSAMLHPAQTEKAIRQYFSQAMSSPQNAAQFAGENIGPGELAKALVGAKAMAGMTAYHGSPHKFDAFDSSKIGTGEGAQAYGHGLYFAEDPNIAHSYKQQLAKPDFSAGNLTDEGHSLFEAKVKRAADEYAAKYGKQLDQSAFAEKILNEMPESAFKPTGHLYNVDIPDEHINKMLDWDAPLSEQPEVVRKWFESRGITEGFAGRQSGGELYTAENRAFGSQEAVSKAMREAGIPGVRYLDHGSRFNKVEKPTRNFVVFDDSIVKILKRE